MRKARSGLRSTSCLRIKKAGYPCPCRRCSLTGKTGQPVRLITSNNDSYVLKLKSFNLEKLRKTASLQMLVVFHVEPHPEEQRLQSADDREYHRHGIDAGDDTREHPHVEEPDRQGDTGCQEEEG